MSNVMETLPSSNSDITEVWRKKFDMMFCLNFASNIERRKTAEKRFERIGVIPNTNFDWMFNFQSPYEHVVFDVTKNLKLNECINIREFNCMMGHYRMIKTALEMKCNRILIFEDDNRFLKDGDSLRKYIANTPDDADVVLYSYTLIGDFAKVFNKRKQNMKVNNWFCSYCEEPIWGCGFYSLSRKAMEEFAFQYELHARVADSYTTHIKHRVPLKKVCSIKCLSIQKEDDTSMHKGLDDCYTKMGCKLGDYE